MASRTRFYTCSACTSGGFTQTGLQSHLQQSTDPRCITLYNEMMDFSLDEAENRVNDGQPQPFAGDAFGGSKDYVNEDFGQVYDGGDDNLGHGDIEDDDEEGEPFTAAQHIELETGWEPERPGARGVMVAHPEDMEPQEQVGHDPIPTGLRRKVENCITDKTFVVHYSDKYPHCRAGMAVKQKQPRNAKYCAILDDSSNMWAPFSSQMDWEIAKWAKLCGAGSTAFSDLLAIKGVSEMYYDHSCLLTMIFKGSRCTQPFVQEFKRAQQNY